MVQQRLTELGFDPGPVDGQFGGLTRAAVWAFEKLVLQTPRAEATGRVTNEMWSRMQDPSAILPRRPNAASVDHTEIYLPEQVVIFFVGDRPALISHMASGTGEEWCDEVTISPGEMGNEDGTEPLKRGECGRSDTPGRRLPLLPARRGRPRERARRACGTRCTSTTASPSTARCNVPLRAGVARVHPHPADALGDVPGPRRRTATRSSCSTASKEPEAYGAQLPTFNWRDPRLTDRRRPPRRPPDRSRRPSAADRSPGPVA